MSIRYHRILCSRSIYVKMNIANRDHHVCQDCADPDLHPDPNDPPNTDPHPLTEWMAVYKNTLTTPPTPLPTGADPDALPNLITLCRGHLKARRYASPANSDPNNPQRTNPRQRRAERPTDTISVNPHISRTTHLQIKQSAQAENISIERLYRRLLEVAIHLYLDPQTVLPPSPLFVPDDSTQPNQPLQPEFTPEQLVTLRDLLFPEHPQNQFPYQEPPRMFMPIITPAYHPDDPRAKIADADHSRFGPVTIDKKKGVSTYRTPPIVYPSADDPDMDF